MEDNKFYIIVKTTDSTVLGRKSEVSETWFSSRKEARDYIKTNNTQNIEYNIIPIEKEKRNIEETEFFPVLSKNYKPNLLPKIYDGYRDMLSKAKKIAIKAHEGQFDKGGNPYICHVISVSSKCKTEEGKIVGLLHDVIEKTNMTYKDLEDAGFNSTILEALRCVTKESGYDTEEYMTRIKNNPIAKEVKSQELLDNLDINRLESIEPIDEIISDLYNIELDYLDGRYVEYPKEKMQTIEKKILDYRSGITTNADIAKDLEESKAELKKANLDFEKHYRVDL